MGCFGSSMNGCSGSSMNRGSGTDNGCPGSSMIRGPSFSCNWGVGCFYNWRSCFSGGRSLSAL